MDTYPQSIIIKFLNFKNIFIGYFKCRRYTRIFTRYFTCMYPKKNEM